MRFPNQRYGDPEHLKYYTQGWTLKTISKHLKRDEKTIQRWLSGKQKMPWWVPEFLRLERYEKYHQLQQMRVNPTLAKLGIVRGQVLDFPDIHAIRAQREYEASSKTIIEQMNDILIRQYK